MEEPGVSQHTPFQLSPPELPPPDRVALPAGLSNLPTARVHIGRCPELAALAAALRTGTRIAVVSGLGGVGKSSLAAAYARRYAADHTGVWWFTASSPAAAEAGLADLTRRLCPQAASHPDAVVLTSWGLSWLAQQSGLLLVWDDVQAVDDVRKLIAGLHRATHLVTSRRSSGWHPIGVAVPLCLKPMPPGDAAELFTLLAGTGPGDPAVGDLCQELGHLPLAVEQAGVYVAESGISVGEYLAALHARTAIGWTPEGTRADRTIAGIWRTTLEELAETPMAARVLGATAWLGSAPVPVVWLAEAIGTKAEIREALRRLNAHSMISLSPEGAEVNRMIQAVMRMPDPDDPLRRSDAVSSAQRAAVDVLAAQLPVGDLSDPQVVKQWRRLLPHITSFAAHSVGRYVPYDAAHVMDSAFAYLRTHDDAAAALQVASCSLAAEEGFHGNRHLDTLASRHNVAIAFESLGDHAAAIAIYRANLGCYEQLLHWDHPNILATRNNLAHAYASAGDLAEAIDLYRKALAHSERVLGSRDPWTILVRANLETALADQNARRGGR